METYIIWAITIAVAIVVVSTFVLVYLVRGIVESAIDEICSNNKKLYQAQGDYIYALAEVHARQLTNKTDYLAKAIARTTKP